MTLLVAHFGGIRLLHVSCVILSGSLFLSRGLMRIADSPVANHRALRVASYVIDSALLAAGIALAIFLHQYPLIDAWLTTKVSLLIVYITLGLYALKLAQQRSTLIVAYLGALLTYALIIGVGVTHQFVTSPDRREPSARAALRAESECSWPDSATCKVLLYLVDSEGTSQIKLAELTDIEPMAMVRILDRMEADGWLERRSDPADRRARCLYLKGNARPLVGNIWRLMDLTHREGFAGISAKQVDLLIALLGKVRNNFAALEPLPANAQGAAASRRDRSPS